MTQYYRLAPSPLHGQGVFAQRRLPRGFRLPYLGRRVFTRTHTDHRYCVELIPGCCLRPNLPLTDLRNPGPWVNAY